MRGSPSPAPRRSGLAAPIRIATLALLLGLAGCAGTLPSVEGETETLSVARQLIERREYAAAIELLTGYVGSGSGRRDVDAAIYLLGDAHLRAKEPALAQIEFERLLRDYPESDSSGSASYQLGAALEGQSRGEDFDQEFTVRAIDQYERFRREHPNHPLRDQAATRIATLRAKLARKLMNTGDLYISLRQPEAARVYFQRVVTDFPETPLVGNAEIGLAWCEALSGRKDAAVATLRELETRFAGQPLAREAAAARKRVERLKPPDRRGIARGPADSP